MEKRKVEQTLVGTARELILALSHALARGKASVDRPMTIAGWRGWDSGQLLVTVAGGQIYLSPAETGDPRTVRPGREGTDCSETVDYLEN